MQKIKEHDIIGEIWQFPTILIPLEVNEAGESIVLRPVESKEAMTVSFYKMKNEILSEIVNELGRDSILCIAPAVGVGWTLRSVSPPGASARNGDIPRKGSIRL